MNIGTSSVTTERAVPESAGRVMRLPRLHVEVDGRSEATPYGGLVLATALLRRFDVADTTDRHVHVLKAHKPYHVLALAMKQSRQATGDASGRGASSIWTGISKSTMEHSRREPIFSRTGTWSYQPLLVSLAGSGECLAIENQPGNLRSSENAGVMDAIGFR